VNPIKAVDGYYGRKFTTWRAFQSFIDGSLPRAHEYIWRGHRQTTWVLEPTIDRMQQNTPANALVTREDVLESFRRAVTGRRGSNPRQLEETELWALGQHFGLATPFLDWTRSPYAAVYFAFEEDGTSDQTRRRAVFGLHRPAVEHAHDRAFAALGDAVDMVEVLTPMVDENARLVSQGGLFTRTMQGRTVDGWVRDVFAGEAHPILVKLELPNRLRADILRSLNRMNINALSLFPDLEGAARYVNMSQLISDY
jgi:hypothetical protein